MKRDHTIDIAKGFAILLMLIGHCSSINHCLFKLIFSFHMPLFFILSGYFFKEKDSVQLIRSDFQKLVIPYIVTIVIVATCTLFSLPISGSLFFHKLLGGIYGCIGSYRMLFPSHTFNCHAGPAWFLLSIFWCRTYFNTIYKYKRNHYMLLSCLLFIAFWLIGMLIVNIPLCIGSGFTGILFYAMGVRLKDRGILNFNYWQYILIVLIWLFAAYYGNINMSQYNYCIGPGALHNILSFPISIMGALCGTLVICKLSSFVRGNFQQIMTFIGTHTLGILCCHTVAFALLSNTMRILSLDTKDALAKDIVLVSLSIGLSAMYITLKNYKEISKAKQ